MLVFENPSDLPSSAYGVEPIVLCFFLSCFSDLKLPVFRLLALISLKVVKNYIAYLGKKYTFI